MDDTNSRYQMFKNQLVLLLDSFEVCSKATTKKSVCKLTPFFSHTARSMQTHLRQEVPAHPHTQSEDPNILERSEFSCPR